MKTLAEILSITTSAASVRRSAVLFALLTVPFAAAIFSMDAAQHATPAASSSAAPSNSQKPLSAVAQLGQKMFFDPSLSGSGQLACASCHSPENAYAPPNGLAVQLGGPDMKRGGLRATPSLRYLEFNPRFTIGPNASVPDNDAQPSTAAPASDVKVASVAKASKDAAALTAAEAKVPQGGLDWDGRANSFQNQALGPLLDPNEMDNHSAKDVLDRVKNAPYAEDLKLLFGAHIFDQPELALSEVLFALARFQFEDPSFHPYDSKYDYYLAGKAKLSEVEARGLKLFEDPEKGNCSSCHIDKFSLDHNFPPAFTDYQFEAFGAPRNRDIPANSDPHYYDLGLCGPLRKDYVGAAPYCGLFKTPTLRNVATRKVFFHNGVFHSLDDVMHFYVERETNAAKWYPKLPNGELDVYNDLPPEYRGNVDVADAPFDRKQGDQPALNDAEIADVIAFLGTLTDGYKPDQPQANAAPKAK
jgi:cytochrome c peroxidase